MCFGERRTDGHQIVPGVKSFRNSNLFAQRFAIAHEGATGEDFDLATRVVDVILAANPITDLFQKVCECIAEHCAAHMTDMHGTRRVRGDILDVDVLARAEVARAISRACLQHVEDTAEPDIARQAQVDETRSGDSHFSD